MNVAHLIINPVGKILLNLNLIQWVTFYVVSTHPHVLANSLISVVFVWCYVAMYDFW